MKKTLPEGSGTSRAALLLLVGAYVESKLNGGTDWGWKDAAAIAAFALLHKLTERRRRP